MARDRATRRDGAGLTLRRSGAPLVGARIASVDARTDVTVLVLTREVLEDSFSPDTWEGLLAKTLVERFRELDARMIALSGDQPASVG